MKRCFILGNGPSLNDIDLRLLKDEITFGTNRVYLPHQLPNGEALDDFSPTYYVCVNPLVLEQFGEEAAEKITSESLFIPEPLIEHIDADNIVPIDTSARTPVFQRESKEPMWEGHTVTYVALQLAYQMGFREIILLGVDHYYGAIDGNANQKVMSVAEDKGHFHPDYFGPGVEWHLPDLAMSEIAYSLAKKTYESDGGCITNATARTRLKTFPLETFQRVMSHRNYKVSALVSAYHSEGFFQDCLNDISRQTLYEKDEVEIVVVTQRDGPEHNIIKGFAPNLGALGKINLILTDDIPTVYEAWNIAARHAHGKYLTNANTDDRHSPKAYEIMANVLDTNEHIDLVYHDSFITWEQMGYKEFVKKHGNKQLAYGRVEGMPGIFNWPDYSKEQLNKGCFIGPQPMWRATLHQRHGLFSEEYRSAGDYEFWLRIAGEDNFFHIPKPLGLYHASHDGIEMSGPELSQQETAMAVQSHADPGGMRIERWGEDRARLYVGDNYTITGLLELKGLVQAFLGAHPTRTDTKPNKTKRDGEVAT